MSPCGLSWLRWLYFCSICLGVCMGGWQAACLSLWVFMFCVVCWPLLLFCSFLVGSSLSYDDFRFLLLWLFRVEGSLYPLNSCSGLLGGSHRPPFSLWCILDSSSSPWDTFPMLKLPHVLRAKTTGMSAIRRLSMWNAASLFNIRRSILLTVYIGYTLSFGSGQSTCQAWCGEYSNTPTE